MVTDSDRELVLRLFGESAARLEKVVAAIPAGQWTARVDSGTWSAAEITEHLVLTERSVLRVLNAMLARSPQVEPNRELDEMLMDRLPARASKATAPERVRPAGSYATPEEGVEAFREARQAVVEWFGSTQLELRKHRLPHPAVGEIDGVQWLLFLSLHCERHVRQMEEVASALAKPGQAFVQRLGE